MSIKTKNSTTEKLANLSAQLGILLMTAATTVGMLELPDHNRSPIALPNQPVFAFANDKTDQNPIRREREETAPHYISYSVSQRTPARSGKR